MVPAKNLYLKISKIGINALLKVKIEV